MKPNIKNLTITIGVIEFLSRIDTDVYRFMFEGSLERQFEKEPDICTDGGNDKEFFTFTYDNQKFFAAVNEINGITVMLPEEY